MAHLSKGSLVLAYALCSASMLILNKWALLHFPLPAMLTLLQCAATALIVILVRTTGLLKIDTVTWAEVWSFLTVPVLFAFALYSSSQLLHYADAGLQILIRTTTPVAVCILDYLFMGYELPSKRSTAALVGLVLGAAFYFRVEAAITTAAIVWSVLYFISISIEMVWVKNILNTVRMSTWTRVLITNTCTALFMAPFGFVQPECVAAHARAVHAGHTCGRGSCLCARLPAVSPRSFSLVCAARFSAAPRYASLCLAVPSPGGTSSSAS